MLALARALVALGRIAGEDVLPIVLEPGQEERVPEQAVFGDLCVTRAELAFAQGRENGNVGQDEARLVKRADQVLPLLGVDARLAADGRVDLGQQRRRHLHYPNATPEDRSGEACKVADNAPAKGNHAIAPLDAEFEKRLAQLRQHGKALARFPGSDDG